MWRLAKLTIAAPLLACLSSCSLFDFGIEWRGGPYALVSTDTDSDTSLSRDLGGGSWIGRVDATVFAVGRNDRFVVAKQQTISSSMPYATPTWPIHLMSCLAP
jgi:hypothetical protein